MLPASTVYSVPAAKAPCTCASCCCVPASVGRVDGGSGSGGDIGADGAEADVIQAGLRILIDVQVGRIGRGVDDAHLGKRLAAGDALAAGKRGSQDGERSQPAGACGELEAVQLHGRIVRKRTRTTPIVWTAKRQLRLLYFISIAWVTPENRERRPAQAGGRVRPINHLPPPARTVVVRIHSWFSRTSTSGSRVRLAHGHVAGKHLEASSAARLGAVHGGVDASQQNLGIHRLILHRADPDADRQRHLELSEFNRLRQRGHDLAGNLLGLVAGWRGRSAER